MSKASWSAALLNALRADDVEPIYLAELAFDSGTERLHTGLGSISYGGDIYTGVGSFGQVGVVEEGANLSPYAVELTLSGIDQNILDLAQNEQYFMRQVTVYLGALDATGALIDAGLLFLGYAMAMPISAGGEQDIVTLRCESEAALLERSRDLRFTDAQLQSEYPGDLGLEYMAQLVNADPQWRGNEQLLTGRITVVDRIGGGPRGPGENFF